MTDAFPADLALMVPELFLACGAMALLLIGAIAGNRATPWVAGAGALILLAAGIEAVTNPQYAAHATAFDGMFVTDGFATVMKMVITAGLAAALAISVSPLRIETMSRFEYPVLVMLSGLGMMLMVSANDFLSVYVGLEMSSLALYVLASFRRETMVAAEAGMKYFILGALSSGLLLFGISLIYGFAGTTNFDAVAQSVGTDAAVQHGLVVGMAFLLAGLAFKISAVPFHMWTPDVYQGAPSPVTALFAMVPKIAAIAMLIRILFVPFGGMTADWVQIIAFVALASMIWGSLAAIAQSNIKRLLAYSSIGNVGYALVGVIAGTPEGVAATLFYMAIYLAMTAGTFAVLLTVRRDSTMAEGIGELAGLSRTRPVVAYVIAIMMFSMSGLPPMAGFFGKLMVFQAAVEQQMYLLAIVGVVTSVVASYYYLRVIKVMFFDKPTESLAGKVDAGQWLVAALSVIIILGLILMPQGAYTLFLHAAGALLTPAT